MAARVITLNDRFVGKKVDLRLVTEADCGDRYVSWLADPEVNQYLETRWATQTLDDIRGFVRGMLSAEHSYLFAMLDKRDGLHVGNIKIGPIATHHSYADISYFIGERSRWGQGLASDAIQTAADIAFARCQLHRVQAGVYEKNQGSCRALEKAGFVREGVFRKQLKGRDGWEDHIWYGKLREDS